VPVAQRRLMPAGAKSLPIFHPRRHFRNCSSTVFLTGPTSGRKRGIPLRAGEIVSKQIWQAIEILRQGKGRNFVNYDYGCAFVAEAKHGFGYSIKCEVPKGKIADVREWVRRHSIFLWNES
jgi:hypothetical protein